MTILQYSGRGRGGRGGGHRGIGRAGAVGERLGSASSFPPPPRSTFALYPQQRQRNVLAWSSRYPTPVATIVKNNKWERPRQLQPPPEQAPSLESNSSTTAITQAVESAETVAASAITETNATAIHESSSATIPRSLGSSSSKPTMTTKPPPILKGPRLLSLPVAVGNKTWKRPHTVTVNNNSNNNHIATTTEGMTPVVKRMDRTQQQQIPPLSTAATTTTTEPHQHAADDSIATTTTAASTSTPSSLLHHHPQQHPHPKRVSRSVPKLVPNQWTHVAAKTTDAVPSSVPANKAALQKVGRHKLVSATASAHRPLPPPGEILHPTATGSRTYGGTTLATTTRHQDPPTGAPPPPRRRRALAHGPRHAAKRIKLVSNTHAKTATLPSTTDSDANHDDHANPNNSITFTTSTASEKGRDANVKLIPDDEDKNKGKSWKQDAAVEGSVVRLTDDAYRSKGNHHHRPSKKYGSHSKRGIAHHHNSLVRVPPNESTTSICPVMLRGRFCTDPFCRYRHENIPREYTQPIYCHFFQQHGMMCSKGKDCPFRHVKVNVRCTDPCLPFQRLGYCTDTSCPLLHIRPQSVTTKTKPKTPTTTATTRSSG